ncbi:MAG: CoA ester lyase [Gammaproteobacteria bacterium]|nr:CoA ester lyase [Gammaproteobacteria bacterium]MDH3430519.1 CoA ester lyase [Gammaproteobacteria bacterium]MDH3433104.1 CoA ester lyase [Gammaproteobacteria bacterium]
MNRSYLFVPADSERKMKKAGDAGADAIILDLEDSVAAGARVAARERVGGYLAGRDDIWVRINPVGTDDAVADLNSIMPFAPTGIVLPKPCGVADVQRLAAMLDELEREHGLDAGRTEILPICTERPEALFGLGGYADATPRLAAMSWGAEDLSAAVGASANRGDDGNWLPPYELARSLCLFAAGAAEVPAVDTVYTDFRDMDGLARYAANARRDGFCGMLAIHPAQVDVINRAFMPSAAEIERAERIVALFAENPEAGALGMDGEMLDRPHHVQAQRILQLAKRLAAVQEKGCE